jgi:long-chain acyl-CoA synthetase
MRGYLGRADATAQTVDAEGWLHTGDVAYVDEEGFFFIVDRKSDMIIRGGENVYPREIDELLYAHPAVAEAAAVAAPDELRGQVVRAVVVPNEGYEPGERLARELQEHVKQRTAPYKYPRIVDFAEALPKTASGKVKRAKLRES